MRYLLVFLFLSFSFLYSQSNSDCMQCHSDKELTGLNADSTEVPMYVDQAEFKASIHGDLDCVDCHQDLQGVEEFPHNEDLEPVSCENCHEDVGDTYNQSKHGLKFVDMEELAPKCWDCHGSHDILPSDNPASRTSAQKLPLTCCGCHEKRNLDVNNPLKQPCVIQYYLKGVHGKALMEGNDAAPNCNTCHPAHEIRKRIDPQSTVYKLNISKLCGKCHIEELEDYSLSIHARALKHGMLESATCTDCHGEHMILSPDSAYFVSAHEACVRCHNNPDVIKKYGLPKNVVSTYEDSYHGRSVELRRRDAATCASCHNYHDVLEEKDLRSTVNENNLVQTCRKCHPEATESFANSYTHEQMLIKGDSVNYYIRLIYIILIVSVIGAMFLHNLIIYLKYIGYKKKEEKRFYIIRFTPVEIFQHIILMLSFTILAISGFALRFSDAAWVQLLEQMGIGEVSRGIIHRVAAVFFVAISLYHLFYLFFTKRGKQVFKQMMLRFSDIPETVQTVQYYLGLRKAKPKYEEFDYTEKAEYWALVWGGIVMGITGIILWFPVIITWLAPSWIVRAAELIHYYEAILATLAILVFHLFFVIAHPEQYPMNLSWLTGKMSLKAAIRKHPKWIERLLKEKKELDLLPDEVRANCETVDDIKKLLSSAGPEDEETKFGKFS